MSATTDQEIEQPGADQRTNLRAPLIIQKILIDTERPVFFGYSKNISRSGMFIATTNQIKLGEQITLTIPLPAPIHRTIICRCEVVWKRPRGKQLPFEPGLGIKFLDLPKEFSELLDGWIKEEK